MRKTGILGAMALCRRYERMGPRQREALRERRLRELVAHARANSPYFKELYRDVPENFVLSDLPPTDKRTLMARWDDWVCDRELKLADVERFMADKANIGARLRGEYLVFTTSGSTGSPLTAVVDRTANSVMGAISACRSFARSEDMRSFIKRGGKSMGVFADDGFYLGNTSIRSRLRTMPWKRRQLAVSSALYPVEKIVEQLNAFQPAMLGGYPSNLELLIDEAKAGRLHIAPVLIMTGGEYLSDELRQRLSETFRCYVQTSYSCTEGGTVACECTERHFHVNDDWLILEPVDAAGAPVPDGVRSDKLLLTNLYNYAQPFIRYEVTDRVILHREKCPCGNPSPWLELEGRTDDVTVFAGEDREVRIAPLSVYAVLKEVHTLRRFQVLAYPDNRVELRLEPAEGADRQTAFGEAKTALEGYLASQGVRHVTVVLAPDPPRQDPGSGKFKHIVNMQKQ